MIRSFKSSFIHILLSLILVTILPILIITLYFYPMLNNLITEQTLKQRSVNISDIKKSIDIQIDQIYKLPVAISTNYKLSAYTLNQSKYKKIEGIREFKDYFITNNFVDGAFLWYENCDYILSSSVIKIDEINRLYFIESMEQVFKAINQNSIRRTEKMHDYLSGKHDVKDKVIAFTLPGPTQSSIMVIEVNDETIRNIVNSTYDDENIIILNSKNDFLFSQKTIENDFITMVIDTLSDLENDSIGIYNIDGMEYVLSYEKSDVIGGVQYIQITPYENVVGYISKSKSKFLWIITILILIEAILIFILSKINYSPIRKLIYNLGNKERNKKLYKNEYDMIQKQVDTLNLKYKIVYKHNLIKDVINKNIITLKKFNELGASINIGLTGNYFNITMIKFKVKDPTATQVIKDLDLINFPLPENIKGYYTYGFIENSLILLSGATTKYDLKKFLSSLYSILENHERYYVYIGKSIDYDNISDMSKAYIEAVAVVDYQILKGIKGVFEYELIPQMDSTICYPSKTIFYFRTALLQNNIDKANKQYKKLIDLLKNKYSNISVVKMVIYNIYNILIGFDDNDNRQDVSSSIYDKNISIPEMIDIIETQYDRVRDNMKNIISNKQNDIITDILIYINNHYSEYDLSLQRIADQYEMTQSNLSHYFKNNTNINFKDYLNRLRVDKSVDMLVQSDMTINEIAIAIGFSSTSTFTRNFKQQYNVSPSSYRSNNKNTLILS